MQKPVLKKSLQHLGSNVILTFKSIEICLIDDAAEKPKVHSPIYIPLRNLKALLDLPRKQLELTIMSSIHYDKD